MDADKIVKLAIGTGAFDEAVAHSYLWRESYLKIANSKIDSIVTKSENSASLFVSSKKRVLFTNIEKPEESYVNKALSRAKGAIRMLQPKSDYFGIVEGPFKYSRAGAPDKKIMSMDNAELAEIAQSAIDAALDRGAEKVAGMLYVGASDEKLATSKRVHAAGSQSEARLSVRVFKSGRFSFQDVSASTKLAGIDPVKLGSRAAEMLNSCDRNGKIGNGTYDVIYAPSPGGSLVSMTNEMACIGNVETGGFFTGKLNKQVANKQISIYDDGNMKGAIGSSPYDSEGYPTQRTAMVRNGKLVSYLHNSSTAKKYKTRSTGNAGLVLPDPNTTFFEHRKRARDVNELVRKVERGILVTNTWYTRFSNYLTGDFSTVPRDLTLYIENGQIKFAIRQRDVAQIVGIRISDNMIRMLKNTECAADDTTQTTSWDSEGDYYFMPSILVRDATVTVA